MFEKRNIAFFSAILLLKLCLSLQTPVISFISPEQIKKIGDAVEINCSVQNVEDFSVAWSKRHRDRPSDSVILSIGNSLTVKDSRYKLFRDTNDTTTTYSLEIKEVEAIDMGIYECQVIKSAAEKITATVELLVKHPPVILEAHTTSVVSVGENRSTELVCSADGYPRPSITWKRDFNHIMPTGGHIYSGSILKLKSANRADRGTYYCIADNGVGSDQKKISLEVEFPPKVSTPRPKIAQALDYDIELKCKIEAYPAPDIAWYKDNEQISDNKNYQVITIGTAYEITSSIVKITAVNSDNYGYYYCNATNKMGHDSAKLHLFETPFAVQPHFEN